MVLFVLGVMAQVSVRQEVKGGWILIASS